jgi:hypothetical protein
LYQKIYDFSPIISLISSGVQPRVSFTTISIHETNAFLDTFLSDSIFYTTKHD